jgi:hypothetical protein
MGKLLLTFVPLLHRRKSSSRSKVRKLRNSGKKVIRQRTEQSLKLGEIPDASCLLFLVSLAHHSSSTMDRGPFSFNQIKNKRNQPRNKIYKEARTTPCVPAHLPCAGSRTSVRHRASLRRFPDLRMAASRRQVRRLACRPQAAPPSSRLPGAP